MAGSQIKLLADVKLAGSLQFTLNAAGFPDNPEVGTIFFKDECIYAYIKLGASLLGIRSRVRTVGP